MSGVKRFLTLPPRIFAVVGMETNIYFGNLTMVINFRNYAFDIECEKGRLDAERWRWIPKESEIGTFPLKISMWSDAGVMDEAQTEIVVSPADAGNGKTSAFLYVGASCTVSPGHGIELYERFQRPGNPAVSMLGSQAPGYGKALPGGPAVEAYGGWTWSTYFLKDHVEETDNADGMHPRRPYDVPSPFLFDKNGKMAVHPENTCRTAEIRTTENFIYTPVKHPAYFSHLCQNRNSKNRVKSPSMIPGNDKKRSFQKKQKKSRNVS